MQKKILTLLVLLMTAVTGAWAETTIVTWTSSGSYENNNSRGGVTLSGDVVEYIWDELTGGEWRLAYDSNQGTFMTSLGNFTSIVISGGYIHGFSGTGWNGKTWTGNASSVPFSGYLTDANGEEPWTITFTIAPATVAVTGVTLAPTSATLTLGETETVTLTATVLPDEATDKSVTWSSSNTSVATVSNEGVVTAVAAGEATITVTTTDGAKTATCAVTVAAPAASTYTVTLKEGTEDADNWTITPEEAKTTGVAEGTEITATYSGTKLVKSVKAVKKPEPKLDLATVTADTTVEDGYTVFGTLGANVKISIADGATVTLDGVTIPNGQIACSGNATIILMGDNTVTGANAAIKIGGSGTTLTITGSGSLTAQGGWGSAGIGTDSNGSGGNIVINGGTVTATGGMYGAGIGTGNAQGSNNTCGDITINGGRVTAQGGSNAAGIGTGISAMSMSATSDSNNTCGAITIGTGVTMVTATKGSSAPNSIGKGKGGMGANQACGTITIGGDATTYAAGVTTSPFTYPAP